MNPKIKLENIYNKINNKLKFSRNKNFYKKLHIEFTVQKYLLRKEGKLRLGLYFMRGAGKGPQGLLNAPKRRT